MKIVTRCKRIAAAMLACALGTGVIAVPATTALAGTNGLTALRYKYYWMDPGIGVVHWSYTTGYHFYESRHIILANKPGGGTEFKYADWESPGYNSMYGHNLLGGQLESWGEFRLM